MKLPLDQMLIRLTMDELCCIIIEDRPNCKTLKRCVTGAGALRDPIMDDYKHADVWCVTVNGDGILELEAIV